MTDEIYSNPLAPPDSEGPAAVAPKQQLRNADFRKLLETPRPRDSSSAAAVGRSGSTSTPSSASDQPSKKEKRSKKKDYYKSKREEEDDLQMILKNYRDRAAERRTAETFSSESQAELMRLEKGLHGVAAEESNFLPGKTAAERRKQMISESKYLGGDMEHTHLVKGLDYALLQKVRSEMVTKETEEDDIERAYQNRKAERDETESQIKSTLARNIYSVLFKNDEENPSRNELFAPRRMAYVIEVDDDFAESDIPTTLIRSKQDCPVDEASTNLSTNDIVIQELTRKLSYLRGDTKRKKKDKGFEKDVKPEESVKTANQGIYEDLPEYVPRRDRRAGGDDARHAANSANATSSRYFEESNRSRGDDSRRRSDRAPRARSLNASSASAGAPSRRNDKNEADDRLSKGWAPADISRERAQKPEDPSNNDEAKKPPAPTKTKSAIEDSYVECYPEGAPEFEAGDDSDDEADYTKMDMGNRKGPIRRWDFEDEDQYESYMSKREAMPKAAYQYGVKMGDGRKTRKTGGGGKDRDEKQKIDRQWNEISKLLSKRKDTESSNVESKKMRY